MLLGDLMTAVTYDLPVKFVVFDNGRLGMVKLEQEQGGLPEHGTVLHNPDLAAVARAIGLHAVRVEDPDDARWRRSATRSRTPARSCSTCSPTRRRSPLPGKVKLGQAWGFAIAKMRETVLSQGDG